MRGIAMIFVAGCVLCAAGCNTLAKQPEFKDACIEPATLTPGATGIITVKVVDKHKVVAKVEGVIKEAPDKVFRLNDEGKNGDAKAGDGIWSMTVKLLAEAPEGQYTIDFKAYRSDGLPVPIRLKKGGVSELICAVPVIVAAPPAQ